MLSGYKSYIVGAVAIIGAIASYLVGDATIPQSVQLVVTALMGMTVRHAVAQK